MASPVATPADRPAQSVVPTVPANDPVNGEPQPTPTDDVIVEEGPVAQLPATEPPATDKRAKDKAENPDHDDNGHGNDEDGFDESNPGGKKK